MDIKTLQETAKKLVAPGKGILATDATEGTLDKRMLKVGLNPTPELRREFREILLKTEGINEFISGVILNDEIIRQRIKEGLPFAEIVKNQGVIPGIKVDKKTHDMANFPGEKIAEGLDGLRDRLTEYRQMGAQFAKFRSVITIGEGIPTQVCIDSNSEVQGRYAALCQNEDIVPIIEPEIVMDGNHSMQRCEDVTRAVLLSTFNYLKNHKVNLSGILLKPNMILPGEGSSEKPDAGEVAKVTLEVLKRVVPDEVPGVVFLSGGQDAKLATLRLNEMNKIGGVSWQLAFSFERALEDDAMKTWMGKSENIDAAQKAFYHRAKMNSLARSGKYVPELEK